MSSREDRTMAGTSTAHAGRTNVMAAAPSAAHAIMTPTGASMTALHAAAPKPSVCSAYAANRTRAGRKRSVATAANGAVTIPAISSTIEAAPAPGAPPRS